MGTKVSFCKNHPYIRATARCYHCKQGICKECRLHLANHYFCGKRCFVLFQLSEVSKYFKTYRPKIFLIWNSLLTLLVLGMFIFGIDSDNESAQSTSRYIAAEERYAGLPDLSTLRMDSLIQSGKEIRSTILENKSYQLELPLRKGWIINVWQNDYPLLSQPISKTGSHEFPVELDYGRNKLRIAVWNAQQNLVYNDYFEIIYRNPIVDLLSRSVERGNRKYPRLALTFDGGANAAGTEEILTALAERQIKTTVFLTGQFILKFPEFVNRMLEAGHEIGNHTFDHPHLTAYEGNGEHIPLEHVDREFIRSQLTRTDSVFHELTGRHLAPFWRAPFGEYNQQILNWAAECSYMHVRWTAGFDTFDWVEDKNSPIYKSPREVFDHIIKKDNQDQNLNGAIVLMHLGSNRIEDQVYTIVPDLIDELHSRGYAIVPVSELINR